MGQGDPRFQAVREASAGMGGKGLSAEAASFGIGASHAVPPEVRALGESERVYYCKIGGQTVGPVTAADIRDAFAKGQIDGQASVGIQGRKEWFAIRALPQFSHLVTGVSPAPIAGRSAGVPSPMPALGAPALGAPAPPREMTSGQAASQAMPSQAMPPQGTPPRAMPPQGTPPRAMPPQAMPSQAMPPQGTPPRAMPPQGTPPRAMPSRPGLPPPPRQEAPADPGLSQLPPQAYPAPGQMALGALRNDETLVVSPLPHPALLAIGSSTAQVRDPQLEAWQKEVHTWRRRALVFQILSGVLFIVVASLVGILLSR